MYKIKRKAYYGLLTQKQRNDYDLKMAYKVQQALLPQSLPNLEAVDIVAKSCPAKGVGGDFYYFRRYRPEDHSLALIIGDVAGKGISAALLMAMILSKLEEQCKFFDISSKQILSSINSELINRIGQLNTYVTIFHARLDYKQNILHYCRAGHPPPIIWRAAQKKIVYLNGHGSILGIFDNCNLEKKAILFEPGDRIICYTDGITETRNQKGDFFGEERLEDIVAQNANNHPKKLLKSIYSHLNIFRKGVSVSDDATVVILEHKGKQ